MSILMSVLLVLVVVGLAGAIALLPGFVSDWRLDATAVEIEVDTLDQLNEALEAGATTLLLDNMTPPDLRQAVEMTGGRAVLEASGRVTAETVLAIAETGVNYISSGWITHSAPVLDFGLDFVSGTSSIRSRD